MSTITIKDKTFDLKDVKNLYPAVLIKTGYDEVETTEMSLAWIDIESRGRVEVAGYGIFVVISDTEKHAFIYEDRATLNDAIGKLAQQLK